MLQNDLMQTEKELTDARDEVAKERDGHVEDLEKRMFEEQEKVKQLIEDVATNDKLMRAETLPKEALDTATKIKKKFDESQRKLTQYQEYQ